MKSAQIQLLEKKEKYLMPCLHYYHKDPVHLVKGEMQFLFGEEGTRYLDFYGGIFVVVSGHCNPDITKKVKKQIDRLQHSSTFYITQPKIELAEKLAEITPGNLQKSFFVNSGSEAVEGATWLAKLYTQSNEIIALQHSYHGRSSMAMSLTGQALWRNMTPFVSGLNLVPSAYCYRCAFGMEYPDCNVMCARYIERVIQTSTVGKIAAFVAEPIQGVGGVIVPPPEYFQIAQDIIKRYGGLMVVDEVQTGFGRTGGYMFGIEHWGVEPDILIGAKGMANGFPIGVFIATEEVANCYEGPNVSTFGGNPVSATAALANMAFMKNNSILENCREVGMYFEERLLEIKERYPLIGDVRGKGLMWGLELVKEGKIPASQEARTAMDLAKDRGLLIGLSGSHFQVLRMGPPLIISKDDIDEAMEILTEVFDSLTKSGK